MRALCVTIALAGVLVATTCSLRTQIQKPFRRQSTRETSMCIRNSLCHRQFVVAHRANGFGLPENSRAAVAWAVAANVPAVEIDIRQSKDGELFIMHDASLGRTTLGVGKLSAKTSDELSGIQLRGSEEMVPKFCEMYELVRGRALLFLDIKSRSVQKTVEWIAKNGSFDDVAFTLNSAREFEDAALMKEKYPDMIISAEAYSPEDVALIKKFFPRLPEIIDIGFPTTSKYGYILHTNSKIYASSLVFEIGFPFLRPFWPFYINQWEVNFLETNDPLFWMRQK